VDPATPSSASKTKSLDPNVAGTFNLAFSDEFNTPGRSFAQGADPYWTAPNVWNIATNDWEYYSETQVTTNNGNLIITAVQEQTIPQCPYTSGMLNSWNKLCFQGGIVEIRAQLPGSGTEKGWWPAAWMLGNLGKVSHQPSLEAVWPWTYDTCDSNSQWQHFNACLADPSNGMNPMQGRGAPEIDIIESRIGGAPNHNFTNTSAPTLLNTFHFSPKNPAGKTYTGGMKTNNNSQVLNVDGDAYHDFIGSITQIDESFFTDMHTFRLEWYPGERIEWFVDDTFVFSLDNTTLRPYQSYSWSTGQRLVSMEPSYLIFNLALSPIWGEPSPDLVWPGLFQIDYVRVYQKPGSNMECDTPEYPTAEYIQNNPQLYN
jgi:beta-glucanase (GH16 family)